MAVSSYRRYEASEGLPLPLRIGVDAAESMSMKSDGPRVPVKRGLSDQSPCGRS